MDKRPDDVVIQEALTQLRELWKVQPQLQTEAIKVLGRWLADGAPGKDLSDERFDLEQRLRAGESVRCPYCRQTAKVYRRTIHAGMAAQLIRIYKAGLIKLDGWVSVDEIYSHGTSGDYAKLRFWGIIEPKDQRGPDDNASGYWRVTPKGGEFVNAKIRVPTHVLVYNNECIGVDNTVQMDIRVALGTQFSYAQLMS
jgi:hypothetical protein